MKNAPVATRWLAGFVGALVGLVIGAVAGFLVATLLTGGDEFGSVFMSMLYVPVGMGLGAAGGIVAGLCVLHYWCSAAWKESTRRRRGALRTVLVALPVALV